MDKLTPILKWAGGKRQLLSQILPLIPTDFSKYYEPFVGAGAVLLGLQPSKAIINDTNAELINVYRVIETSPHELIASLTKHEKAHCKEYYYFIRDLDRDVEEFEKYNAVEKASRTIYLNRTCYNGLYRVNKQGVFNTPIGYNSSIQIVNAEGILGISEYLRRSKILILNTDYRIALKGASRKDFVFLDPPYYPTKRDSFLRYQTNRFEVQEQGELKAVCDKLTKRGVRFIETNSDCDEIRELYADYHLQEVDVRRSINSHADDRRGKELIIRNY